MERPHRVAVGSILTECNQFGGKLIERAEFARSQLVRGEAVMSIGGGAVGGMLHTLKEQNADIVPLVVASAYPGGPIDHECYAQLKADLLEDLTNALPVDGVCWRCMERRFLRKSMTWKAISWRQCAPSWALTYRWWGRSTCTQTLPRR